MQGQSPLTLWAGEDVAAGAGEPVGGARSPDTRPQPRVHVSTFAHQHFQVVPICDPCRPVLRGAEPDTEQAVGKLLLNERGGHTSLLLGVRAWAATRPTQPKGPANTTPLCGWTAGWDCPSPGTCCPKALIPPPGDCGASPGSLALMLTTPRGQQCPSRPLWGTNPVGSRPGPCLTSSSGGHCRGHSVCCAVAGVTHGPEAGKPWSHLRRQPITCVYGGNSTRDLLKTLTMILLLHRFKMF